MGDVEGAKAELRYFRDVWGHEVDFLILKRSKPWMAIEVKWDERPVSPGLKYLLERVHVPHAFQISMNGTHDSVAGEINGCRVRILPAAKFLLNLT